MIITHPYLIFSWHGGKAATRNVLLKNHIKNPLLSTRCSLVNGSSPKIYQLSDWMSTPKQKLFKHRVSWFSLGVGALKGLLLKVTH